MEDGSLRHNAELARESDNPIEMISKLYDQSFLSLAARAGTNAHLHILVKQRVQEQITRQQKSGSFKLSQPT